MKCCQYIQKVSNCDFLFINGLHCIEDKKCKFFYENLLFKKFKPPCHQALFKRLFSVGKEYWNDIYKNKVEDIYDKRICEFNYKMLNNTVTAFFLNANIGLLLLVICVAKMKM